MLSSRRHRYQQTARAPRSHRGLYVVSFLLFILLSVLVFVALDSSENPDLHGAGWSTVELNNLNTSLSVPDYLEVKESGASYSVVSRFNAEDEVLELASSDAVPGGPTAVFYQGRQVHITQGQQSTAAYIPSISAKTIEATWKPATEQLAVELVSTLDLPAVESANTELPAGLQFRHNFNTAQLPNTTARTTAPTITGHAAADARIQSIALGRGYRLQAEAGANLVAIEGKPVQSQVLEAWGQINAALGTETGHKLGLTSGYRSTDSQRGIFLGEFGGYSAEQITSGAVDGAISEVLKTVSIPGFSRHHTGFTIDVFEASTGIGFTSFGTTASFDWMSANDYANARKFGFIPSYPDGAGAQGPNPEPWEYVWVGVEQANLGF